MINTTARKRVPAQIQHACKTCGQDTTHQVCQPTFAMRATRDKYRECTCLTCGTKDPQVLIHAWRMI